MSVALSAAKIAEKKMSPASQLLAVGAFGQSARFVTTGITQLRLLRHALVRLFVTNATPADRGADTEPYPGLNRVSVLSR
jgi:hypothetical protein